MATTYYLDSSFSGASDSNAGTSTDKPFKTLAALNKAFQPGDTIAIKAGTSYAGTLSITADGTASAPVTFTRYGEGADPVIKATGQTGIDMRDANYVVIDHLVSQGAQRAGVAMDANSAHNTLKNMEVVDAGFAYEITGAHDNLFTGNFVHDLHLVNNTPGGDDDYGGAAFAIQGNNNEFSFNKILNAKAPSYDYGYDGGGFETWKSVSNIKIHDNWVQDSDGFLEIGGQGADDVVSNIEIYNNISYNNGRFGWLHNDTAVGNFGMTINGVNIHNNTIVEPSAYVISGFGGPVTEGTFSFTGNIVYAPISNVVFNQSGNFHSNNYYEAAVAPTGPGEISGSVNFVSNTGDFHVRAGSAAAAYGAYTDGHNPGLPTTTSSTSPGSTGTAPNPGVSKSGTASADTMNGTTGNDTISGAGGNDTLNGLDGNDILRGGSGYDSLSGGNGDDTLDGGSGDDVLTGGAGRDVFHFTIGQGWDRVTDFIPGTDKLHFAGMTAGSISAYAHTWNGISGLQLSFAGDGGGVFLQGIKTLPVSDFLFG
ncbi:hypothetical protein [Paracraurococcus lichenis]|uniref:Uncharacterized protein n=1 Tax=Paracraurococcus lichenis TaxID=3064888 RepID=A0ABT9E9S3_9PROT|nr:hypothetical protein [Paracraurococcus sp. LOR1-02]MDO9712952.1 hypothetical protein [Paracraurococcus sp. LOR1-02]